MTLSSDRLKAYKRQDLVRVGGYDENTRTDLTPAQRRRMGKKLRHANRWAGICRHNHQMYQFHVNCKN